MWANYRLLRVRAFYGLYQEIGSEVIVIFSHVLVIVIRQWIQVGCVDYDERIDMPFDDRLLY